MNKKAWLLIVKYWSLNMLIPLMICLFLVKINFSSEVYFPIFYVVFIAPVVFLALFYVKIKKEATNKFLAVFLAVAMPYVLLIFLVVFLFLNGYVNLIPLG